MEVIVKKTTELSADEISKINRLFFDVFKKLIYNFLRLHFFDFGTGGKHKQ